MVSIPGAPETSQALDSMKACAALPTTDINPQEVKDPNAAPTNAADCYASKINPQIAIQPYQAADQALDAAIAIMKAH